MFHRKRPPERNIGKAKCLPPDTAIRGLLAPAALSMPPAKCCLLTPRIFLYALNLGRKCFHGVMATFSTRVGVQWCYNANPASY